MRCFSKQYQIKELLTGLEGKLLLSKEVALDNVAELTSANERSVCFFEDNKYMKDLTALKAGLLIVPESFDPSITSGVNLFFVQKPYQTFNRLVHNWLLAERPTPVFAVHPSAVIAHDALIQENVSIGENVVIGSRTKIGKGSIVESNAVVGADVVIGENCVVRPNTTIYPFTEIGNRVIIHSSAVLGSDGFGYNFDGKAHLKIHHVGKVVVEDDVEIGANSCIDRATIGQTRIGKGTKIDNLVQVGHNCTIGNHAILCSQVGLAGNTEVGNYVYLAGQVGAAGHLKIHDGAMVGAQSGISRDIPPNGKFFGTPAIDAQLQKRIIVAIKKLPELLSWFNKLKKSNE